MTVNKKWGGGSSSSWCNILIYPLLMETTNALISLLYFGGYLPSMIPQTVLSNYNLSFLEFFSHLLWFIFHLHWHQSLFTFYRIFPKCFIFQWWKHVTASPFYIGMEALINCLDDIFFCEKAIWQNVIIGCLHFKYIFLSCFWVHPHAFTF